jgi:hypothetical protein
VSRALHDHDDDARALDAALCATAILLLIRPPGPFYLRFALVALAVLALVLPGARRDWLLWAAAAAAVGVGIVVQFPLPDNHIYLLAYWCLAIALSLPASRPALTLARSARWLMGLAFLAAVLWKGVLSPDYRDGTFFAVTLLVDERFADVVRLLAGVSDAALAERRAMLLPAFDGARFAAGSPLLSPPAFTWMAWTLTWGGLLLEGAVAVLMLAGRARRSGVLLLLVFCACTYALAPVTGFGCLLLAMAMAQCREDERALRGACVAVFVLVLFYTEVPWAGLLRQ